MNINEEKALNFDDTKQVRLSSEYIDGRIKPATYVLMKSLSTNEKKRTTYLVEGSPPADPPRKQDKKEKTIWNSSWLIQPSSQNAVWLNEIFTFTQQFIEEDHTIFINISLKSEYWAWEKTTRRLQWNDNDLRLYFFVLRNFENFWLFLWMVPSFISLH